MKTMIMMTEAGRSAVLVMIFLVLLFQISVLCNGSLSRGVRRKTWIDVLLVFISMMMMAALAEGSARCSLHELVQGVERAVLDIPAAAAVICIVAIFCYAAWSLRADLKYQKHAITRSSIKESADTLPMGLCFARSSGQTFLVNRRMEELCHVMCGESLQNAEKFWQMVSEGRLANGVQRSRVLEAPALLFPDGSSWVFDRQSLMMDGTEVVQLTASDTTELHRLASRLRQENAMLCGMNDRLEEYGKNVEELTRIRERLTMKVRIHDSIGQNLLATRHLLTREAQGGYGIPVEPVLKKWHMTIAMLRRETEPEKSEGALRYLTDAAESAGVRLVVNGSLPEHGAAEELAVTAGAEALTNAVRHAGAGEIHMKVIETPTAYIVTFTNDGRKPDKPVKEGGGLSGLRRQIEDAGGTMDISAEPEFELKITIPKEGKTGAI